MTKKQLIDNLSDYPDDTEIRIYNSFGWEWAEKITWIGRVWFTPDKRIRPYWDEKGKKRCVLLAYNKPSVLALAYSLFKNKKNNG